MLTLTLAAAVTPDIPIPPSAPWNVEAAENMCLLSRGYGTPPDTFVVGFQPIFTEPRMDFLIVSDAKPGRQDTGLATIQRIPDGKKFTGSFVGLNTQSGGKYVTRISVDRALFDELATATALKVKAGAVSRNIQVVRFDKAKAVFENCENDLLREWGVDPTALREDRGAKPKGDVIRYFQPGSYPQQARDGGYVGRSTVVLNVDDHGTATKCRVIAGAGTLLNEATCQNALKIRFEPGKSRDGKAEPSIYVLRVSWQLP